MERSIAIIFGAALIAAVIAAFPGRAPAQTNGGIEGLSAAGSGVGVTLCSEFNRSRKKAETEFLFFTWAEGYLTGWNLGPPADSPLHAELSSMPRLEQMKFLRIWCESNPTKRYMEGATQLFVRLRQHASQ
jgi:hypothetical protein